MWFTLKKDFIELRIFVKPNAKKTELINITSDELIISVNEKSFENEANKMLLSFLAKLLKLPRRKLQLLRGDTSRHKKVKVALTKTTKDFIEDLSKFIDHI